MLTFFVKIMDEFDILYIKMYIYENLKDTQPMSVAITTSPLTEHSEHHMLLRSGETGDVDLRRH